VLRVDNGSLALAFLPRVGGRLMSLRVDGREVLWRNPRYLDDDLAPVLPFAQWPRSDGTFATWANVGGSKTWPAPQGWNGDGEWAGPPGSVLDSGEWSVEVLEAPEAVTITLSSSDDPRTGLRIVKRFVVPVIGTRFSQHTEFVNVSERTITWSIWEVAQVDTGMARDSGGVVEVGVLDTRIVDLGSYHGAAAVEHRDGIAIVPVQDAVVKRGFPSGSGHIAYREPPGFGVQLSFTPIPAAEYPDEGSRAELWMQAPLDAPIAELEGLHPDAWLVELEVLSPLVTLAPGGVATFDIEWRVTAG